MAPMVQMVPMESLHDSFSEEELLDFDRRVREVVTQPVYVVEPKFDGLSVSLEYRDGLFVRGSTRGDGLVGEDVTENLRAIRTVPKKLTRPIPFLEVRGEVYMSHESFLDLCARQELNDEKPFKNPRNAAAGSLRQKNPKITASRGLDIFVFNVQQVAGEELSSHDESLRFLRELGFAVTDLYRVCRSMDEVILCTKEGKDLLIGFNPKFLIDALRVIEDEEVDLYFMNAKAPCFIKDEDQSYIYLILPVNFNAAV